MTCPYCKKEFYSPPALSRRDPSILCCSRCGTLEALEDLGLSPIKIDDILQKIYGDKAEVSSR